MSKKQNLRNVSSHFALPAAPLHKVRRRERGFNPKGTAFQTTGEAPGPAPPWHPLKPTEASALICWTWPESWDAVRGTFATCPGS